MRDSLGDVQSVVVLGGTSEIALATVDLLVERRLRRLVLAVRDPAAVADVAERYRARDVDVHVVAFDAESLDAHSDVVASIWDAGDIDLVLLAFGVLGDQQESERSASTALRVVRTNFDGAVSVLVPITERLQTQGHGTIAVISSVAAIRPRRANFVYGASKAGLDAFANGLADACVGTGVHVMVVRPGFVHTRMTKGMDAAPFATTPDVVAAAIVDGVRRNATIVYAPAVLRWVAPVLQALPRAVWRRMPG